MASMAVINCLLIVDGCHCGPLGPGYTYKMVCIESYEDYLDRLTWINMGGIKQESLGQKSRDDENGLMAMI